MSYDLITLDFLRFSNRNMRFGVAVANALKTLAPSVLWRCGGSKLFSGQVARKGVLELRELVTFWRPGGCADRGWCDAERRQ